MTASPQTPIPQGKYISAVRYENLIWTFGMTPRDNGILIKAGKLSNSDTLADYQHAVRQAAQNTFNAALNTLADGQIIARLITFTVYVNAEAEIKDRFFYVNEDYKGRKRQFFENYGD